MILNLKRKINSNNKLYKLFIISIIIYKYNFLNLQSFRKKWNKSKLNQKNILNDFLFFKYLPGKNTLKFIFFENNVIYVFSKIYIIFVLELYQKILGLARYIYRNI